MIAECEIIQYKIIEIELINQLNETENVQKPKAYSSNVEGETAREHTVVVSRKRKDNSLMTPSQLQYI